MDKGVKVRQEVFDKEVDEFKAARDSGKKLGNSQNKKKNDFTEKREQNWVLDWLKFGLFI